MAQIPLIAPWQGLNDNFSYEQQPPLTTSASKNVSSVDPITGRERRVGQRQGMEKFNAYQLSASGKVSALASVTYDLRRVDYTDGDGTSEWANVTPSKQDTLGIKTDLYGNVYAIDGDSAIVKYNSAGHEVWRFNVPTLDDAAVCRAFEVDDVGHIYIGVSEGGSQTNARLYCYTPDDDLKLAPLWNEPINSGGFFEDLRFSDNKLYSVENHTDSGRSYLRVYEFVGTSEPSKAAEKYIPYPVNGVAIKPSGEIITSHAPNDDRGKDPRAATYDVVLDDQRWTPESLTDYEKRVWTWLSAETIKDQGGYESVKDGDSVRFWQDRSGNGRNLYEGGIASSTLSSGANSYKAPVYREHGLGYKPGVAFDGDDYLMVTRSSSGSTTGGNSINPTILPGKGKGYLLMIVGSFVDDTASAKKGRIFYQENSSSGGSRELWMNSTNQGSTATTGAISMKCGNTSAGTGESDPEGVAQAGYATNRNGAAIITVFCDNTNLDGPVYSYWRVNGVPMAKFECASDFFTDLGKPSYVGCKTNGTTGCHMVLHEIFVLQSYDVSGTETLATVPDYNAKNVAASAQSTPITSTTEVEKLEAYFAWKYGVADLLDRGGNTTTTVTWNADYSSSRYEHPYHSNDTYTYALRSPVSPTSVADATDSLSLGLLSAGPMMAKWTARLSCRWAQVYAGVGYGAACLSDGSIVTVGPKYSTELTTLQHWSDSGNLPGLLPGQTIAIETNKDYDYQYPRLAVDTYDNVWIPFRWDTATTKYSVLGYDSSFNQIVAYAADSTQPGTAVAVGSTYPDYGDTGITRPEFVFLATENGGDEEAATAHKVRVVEVAIQDGSQRAAKAVGVCGGNVVSFGAAGTPTLATGGSGAIDAAARIVCPIPAFGKVYFLDGLNYKVYDPTTGAVTDWECTSAGAMPQRARWGCLWRGRMVLIRGDDAHNWYMSALGDPTDWDAFPAVQTPTQAIFGNNAGSPGLVPDIINTVIPVGRERLVFGCDHSIHVMYGDPLEGGVITEATSSTGLAFGPSWCFDTDGVLYAFGSRGGVYATSGGTGREGTALGFTRITIDTIDRRMQEIDFSTHYVQLVWDGDANELNVLVCPYADAGSIVKRWRWEKNTKSWQEDEPSNANVSPTCAMVFDGDDPDDRVMLWGFPDGYVRKMSRTAKSDDGYVIDSYTTIGPIFQPNVNMRLKNPKVQLARDQDGCEMQLFASDTPDDIGEIKERVLLDPGQGRRSMVGVRGSYIWVRLRNTLAGQRWAYESGEATILPASRKVAAS